MLIGLKSAVLGILLPLSVYYVWDSYRNWCRTQPGDQAALTCWLSPSPCSAALFLVLLRRPKLKGVECKEKKMCKYGEGDFVFEYCYRRGMGG